MPFQGFFECLFPKEADGFIEFRVFPGQVRRFLRSAHVRRLETFLRHYQGQNIYFGVAIRRTRRGGTLADCDKVFALWADVDFKESSEAEARRRLEEFPIPPSIIVASGGGLHLYWLLAEAADVQAETDRLYDLLRRIAHHIGADLSAAEPARILRVPGTLNLKYDPPRSVLIELFQPDRRYHLRAFEELLPEGPAGGRARGPFRVPEKIRDGERNATLYRLARSLKARGLSEEAILAALETENRVRCDPPLLAEEVRKIAEHGATQPDRPDFHPSSDTGGAESSASENRPRDGTNSGDSENTEAEEGWPPPVPFQEFDPPVFPTDTLPPWLKEFVEANAIETQTPTDLPAMVSLSVLSATCAKKFEVTIKPGYTEPVNIFTATVLEPGNRKSAVFSATTAPVQEFEQEEARRLAPEIAKATARHKIAQGRLQKAQNAAANAEPKERAAYEKAALQSLRELVSITIPVPPRLIVDDITSERLGTLLHENGGRIALLSPEGDLFDLMAGRYSSSGAPNFGVFLRGHSGDPIRVDRVGRDPDYIPRPALTVGITIQPEVLRGLIDKPGFRGRGLLGRFFYSLPTSLLGRRDVDPPSMPLRVRATYDDSVLTLLRLPADTDEKGDPAPHILQLTGAGQQTIFGFAKWLEPQLGRLGDLGDMTDWAGKLVGGVIRIAGLLHIADHADDPAPWQHPIDVEVVKRAIQIGKYLIPHARAAYGEMGADPAVEAARHILRWIITKDARRFTLRELFQGTKGRFKKVESLKPALGVLIDHNFIREVPEPPRLGPGRKPSPTFEVNPAVWAQNAQNSQN